MTVVSSTVKPFVRPSGVAYRVCGCTSGKYLDKHKILGGDTTVKQRCSKLRTLLGIKPRVTKFY